MNEAEIGLRSPHGIDSAGDWHHQCVVPIEQWKCAR